MNVVTIVVINVFDFVLLEILYVYFYNAGVISMLAGNDRSHGHRHDRSLPKDSGNDYSPRTGGFSSRYGDKDKGKDKESSSRSWQQAAGNTSSSSSSWKSPRSNFHAKDSASGGSTSSPRNTSAWSTVGSSGNKPSPATTPSASAGGGSGWFRGDANKTDGSSEKSAESAYVSLGGSKQQGGEL